MYSISSVFVVFFLRARKYIPEIFVSKNRYLSPHAKKPKSNGAEKEQ
jgi:hypothetical protein